MKLISTYYFLFLIILFSCNRKSVDVEIYEEGCKNIPITKSLGLYYPTSNYCQNDTLTKSVHVNFATPQPECIDAIDIKYTTFYRNNGDSILGFTHTDYLTTSDPGVTMSGENFYYYFCFTHPNLSTISELGYLIIYFVAENSLGTESELKSVRVNLPGFQPHPNTYEVKHTVQVPFSSYITISVWDYAAEDGDYIDLYLNNTMLLQNHLLLTEQYKLHNININPPPGTNTLVAYALNEGSSSPNTLGIQINYGDTIKMNPGMLTGEAIEITW